MLKLGCNPAAVGSGDPVVAIAGLPLLPLEVMLCARQKQELYWEGSGSLWSLNSQKEYKWIQWIQGLVSQIG